MFIVLKKKSRAGVLLYAVLMMAVFSLVLQFYLSAQLSEARLSVANQENTEAYLIAEWTADIVREEINTTRQKAEFLPSTLKKEQELNAGQLKFPKGSGIQGSIRFSKGQSHYHSDNNQLFVTVTTIADHDFFYAFPLSSVK